MNAKRINAKRIYAKKHIIVLLYMILFNTDLCKYSDIFEKPNTGPHKYRILQNKHWKGIAIVDVIATIMLSFFLKAFFFKKCNILNINMYLFISGIILHRMFCVRTAIDKILFP